MSSLLQALRSLSGTRKPIAVASLSHQRPVAVSGTGHRSRNLAQSTPRAARPLSACSSPRPLGGLRVFTRLGLTSLGGPRRSACQSHTRRSLLYSTHRCSRKVGTLWRGETMTTPRIVTKSPAELTSWGRAISPSQGLDWKYDSFCRTLVQRFATCYCEGEDEGGLVAEGAAEPCPGVSDLTFSSIINAASTQALIDSLVSQRTRICLSPSRKKKLAGSAILPICSSSSPAVELSCVREEVSRSSRNRDLL